MKTKIRTSATAAIAAAIFLVATTTALAAPPKIQFEGFLFSDNVSLQEASSWRSAWSKDGRRVGSDRLAENVPKSGH